jgi:hypothetical protein
VSTGYVIGLGKDYAHLSLSLSHRVVQRVL